MSAQVSVSQKRREPWARLGRPVRRRETSLAQVPPLHPGHTEAKAAPLLLWFQSRY